MKCSHHRWIKNKVQTKGKVGGRGRESGGKRVGNDGREGEEWVEREGKGHEGVRGCVGGA